MSSDVAIPAGVRELPALYASRLPAADAAEVRDAIAAEEWAWAVQELAAALILADAPITVGERDQLRALCDAVGVELTVPDALVSPGSPAALSDTPYGTGRTAVQAAGQETQHAAAGTEAHPVTWRSS